uniref:Truncated xylanase 5 n=1 Tax=Hypocrea jecorina TaxID=51453 RepID=A0A1B1XXC5_HYPJE|nr:truncated xylanase 5 [Trichoderma reesei]ANW82585.1 truncated xylanase 5 [Trichoderma reesei]
MVSFSSLVVALVGIASSWALWRNPSTQT